MVYLGVFGETEWRQPWGSRLEGHNTSINYASVNGRIVVPTPTFIGSNPPETPLGNAGAPQPFVVSRRSRA